MYSLLVITLRREWWVLQEQTFSDAKKYFMFMVFEEGHIVLQAATQIVLHILKISLLGPIHSERQI